MTKVPGPNCATTRYCQVWCQKSELKKHKIDDKQLEFKLEVGWIRLDQPQQQRQAGLQDEAASDPSNTTSSSSTTEKEQMDGDALLDLLAEMNEDTAYEGGVETPPSRRGDGPKRDGGCVKPWLQERLRGKQ